MSPLFLHTSGAPPFKHEWLTIYFQKNRCNFPVGNDWSVAAVPAKREYVLSEITANVAQRLGSDVQITGHTFLRTVLQDPSFVVKQIDEFSLGITGAHHLFSVRITPPGSFINQVAEVVEIDGCSIQVIYMVLMHSPNLAVCYCRYIKNGSADSITISANHIQSIDKPVNDFSFLPFFILVCNAALKYSAFHEIQVFKLFIPMNQESIPLEFNHFGISFDV